jgi:hypothetical protein
LYSGERVVGGGGDRRGDGELSEIVFFSFIEKKILLINKNTTNK